MKKLAKALRGLRRKSDSTATSATVVAAEYLANPPKLIAAPDTDNGEIQKHDSGLERLPAEVRRHILSVMDLPRLKALTRASPTYHQQYRLDRRYLLSAALQVALGSVCLDAYITQKAMASPKATHESFSGLLDTWEERLPHSSSFQLGRIAEDEVVNMVSFYLQNAVPVARYYLKQVLRNLYEQIGEGSHRLPSQTEPSNTEWQRCLRAAYRFQLLCCAVKSARFIHNIYDDTLEHLAERLFYTPEPWEGEELLSFYEFAEAVYKDIFDDIAAEVHPDNARFDGQDRPPTPEGAFELARFSGACKPKIEPPFGAPKAHTSVPVNYKAGTALRGGLELLRTVLVYLHCGGDREDLVKIMQRNIVSFQFGLVDTDVGILHDGWQRERRDQRPSRKDELTRERALLPFQGDGLSGPPLAWTILWGGTYCNMIGDYIPGKLRQWGYVFWDADRLESCGGRDVLRRQWEYRWDPDEDPRDSVYF